MKFALTFLLILLGSVGLTRANGDDHHDEHQDDHHGGDSRAGDAQSSADHKTSLDEDKSSAHHDNSAHHNNSEDHSDDDDAEWAKYKAEFGEADDHYEDPEEDKRHHAAWKESRDFVKNWSKIAAEEGLDFDIGINKFSDESEEDLSDGLEEDELEKEDLEGLEVSNDEGIEEDSDEHDGRRKRAIKSRKIPESFDWRDKGAVTDVKKQGHVNVCWAFAAVAAMETQIFRKTGQLESLSPEPLINCCKDCYTTQVKGDRPNRKGKQMYGKASFAVDFIQAPGAMKTLDEEPFISNVNQGTRCTRKVSWKDNRKNTVRVIKPLDEKAMKYQLYTVGPLVVNIHASSITFKQWRGPKVYDDPTRCINKPAHLVTIVGYGTQKDSGKQRDYWIVKNSWGEGFGDQGYIKIARGKNMCGIANYAIAPIYISNTAAKTHHST